MKNVPLLIGTLVVTVLMILGVAVLFSNPASNLAAQHTTPVPQSQLIPDVPRTRGATESAQVTLVEFSDYECPACRSVQPLVATVLEQYGDAVQLVFRNYPLKDIHPNAQAAAQFAEAAAEQGVFWEVHDALFAHQAEWADIANQDELVQAFIGYTEGLEVDTVLLQETMNDTTVLDRITKDVADGNAVQITGTPTFYVNGVHTPAPQLLSAVEKIIGNNPETAGTDSGE